jgi:hypothetical protein
MAPLPGYYHSSRNRCDQSSTNTNKTTNTKLSKTKINENGMASDEE